MTNRGAKLGQVRILVAGFGESHVLSEPPSRGQRATAPLAVLAVTQRYRSPTGPRLTVKYGLQKFHLDGRMASDRDKSAWYNACMETRDRHGHRLVKKACKACGELRWMRPQSTTCSRSCSGKIGSRIARHSITQTLLSKEFRQQQSQRLKEYYRTHPDKVTKLLGNDNPAWRHGNARRGYTNFTERLKSLIRERDNDTCQICNYKWNGIEPRLDVHHIDSNKDNFETDNLTTLCKKCHTHLHRQGSVETQN